MKKLFESADSNKPDLIFCTGDIAFGEATGATIADQFKEARIFFDSLLKICGEDSVPLSRDRLLLVPGNHDVNRKKINADAQRALIQWATEARDHEHEINQRFDDLTSEFADAARRLVEYHEFIESYLPNQYDETGRQVYTRIVDIRGSKVGIAGFNSAWSCAGTEDDRNIWLAANWQFNKAKKELCDASLKIGLIHHPTDWFNEAEREIATRRIASDFDFWLHGHSHDAWVTPTQSHVIIGAGAIGAKNSDEFGVNVTSIDFANARGTVNLFFKRAAASGWTIMPVVQHAPHGTWPFSLPSNVKGIQKQLGLDEALAAKHTEQLRQAQHKYVSEQLKGRMDAALMSFSEQSSVWIEPIVSTRSEVARDAKSGPKLNLKDFISNPRSIIIKAPPQYGLTCLARHLAKEAWNSEVPRLLVYLDAKKLKPNANSVTEAVSQELKALGCEESDLYAVIVDSWSLGDKDATKILNTVSKCYLALPIVCMHQAESDAFTQIETQQLGRAFETFYLWALPRDQIRQIVAHCNERRIIGDEDALTSRVVSDLETLNLHRSSDLEPSSLQFVLGWKWISEMCSQVILLLISAPFRFISWVEDILFIYARLCMPCCSLHGRSATLPYCHWGQLWIPFS